MPRRAIYGHSRAVIPVPVLDLTGTTAKSFLTALAPAFGYIVERVSYVVSVPHTGAGGSQTIRVLRGGLVVASAVVTLAAAGTLGAVIDLPVTRANATFSDADTLTVDMTAGGTAFATGSATVFIRYRTPAQRAE